MEGVQGRGVASWRRTHAIPSLISACQVLTIAATEPVSLLHSKPPKPTQARGKVRLLSAPGGQDTPSSTPEAPGPAPEAPSESGAGLSGQGDLSVDFEKIYKYLSAISRSHHGPELSAAGEKHGGQGLWEGGPGHRPFLTPSPYLQNQLWSLTCSWPFLRSCRACPAPPWWHI